MTSDHETRASLNEPLLRALAEFAAGAGHEINNPLATIVGQAQLLLRDESNPDRRLALEAIGGQALRVRDMIGDLMLFARPPEPRFEADDLATAVREVASRFQQEAGTRRIRIRVDVPQTAPLTADRTQLRIVIAELLKNSLEACAGNPVPAGDQAVGTIDVSVLAAPTTEGDGWQLQILDDGPGLGDLDREHAFHPFYSGRPAGRGLGYGLCKCWRIVDQHRGTIELENRDQRGVCARVWWRHNLG